MFNVYLPKLLEMRSHADVIPKTLEQTMWEVVIFTLGGCPGAIVSITLDNIYCLTLICLQLGAYLVDSPLGRRWSLAGSTFVTAAFCYLFILASDSMAVRISTVGISLSATVSFNKTKTHIYPEAGNRADYVGCPIRLDARDFRHRR